MVHSLNCFLLYTCSSSTVIWPHQEDRKSHHPQSINAAKIELRFLHSAPILCFETSTLWAPNLASESRNPHTECEISNNARLKTLSKTSMKLIRDPNGTLYYAS